MSIKTSPASCPQKIIYNLDSNFQITVTITNNPFQLPVDALYAMAMRHNKKRGFLFVSKLLGKHLGVDPHLPFLGGAALAAGYLKTVYNIDYPYLPEVIQSLANHDQAKDVYQKVLAKPMDLPERTLFIGFAETATALGYSVFNCFSKHAEYLHTTREFIPDLDLTISFEEEHSHAVAHRCYPLNETLLAGDHPIVFVDDEITTGKTVLNIIRALQHKFPRKNYAIVSFLDWRSEEEHEQFRLAESELGINIETFSLLSGTLAISGEPNPEFREYEVSYNKGSGAKASGSDLEAEVKILKFGPEIMRETIQYSSLDSSGLMNTAPYLLATGRFGICSDQRGDVEELASQIGKHLQKIRQGSRILCLGTGEFMYLPMRIASYMVEGTVYHSTTRSPIRVGSRAESTIKRRLCFPSPEDAAIMNYLYNIPDGYYDELYLFLERDWPKSRIQPLQEILGTLDIPRVYIVICGPSGIIEDGKGGIYGTKV